MIQRKQTIFLLTIIILLVLMFFTPLLEAISTIEPSQMVTSDGSIVKTMVMEQSKIELKLWGVYYDGVRQQSITFLIGLIGLTILATMISIFSFKKRLLQIRLCFITGVFLIGIIAFQILYIYRLETIIEMKPELQYVTSYSIRNVFSAISFIVLIFAYKGIVKDEALVRSADRIR